MFTIYNSIFIALSLQYMHVQVNERINFIKIHNTEQYTVHNIYSQAKSMYIHVYIDIYIYIYIYKGTI
jgi:hypothetical protein